MKPTPELAHGKIPVVVLGATGSVGQRFVALLADHPWFTVAALAASERSVGRPYREAVRWIQSTPLPRELAELPVVTCCPESAPSCGLAFSALDESVAGEVEAEFARAGRLVVSNAKNHRMHPLVPLVVAEINADHLELADRQRFGTGLILTNPNCSTIGLTMALKPLDDAFGVDRAHVVTMQALSGAGVPGVPGMLVPDNLIPFISGEEEKLEKESRKILGRMSAEGIEDHRIEISAQCNRIGVSDGHTACVSVKLRRRATFEELIRAWTAFEAEPQRLKLPSAPSPPIHYLRQPDAPQPRLHRDLGRGMAIAVGRLRKCPLLDYRFVTLSHNTVRGAAGGALLLAELAVVRGLMERLSSADG